MSFRYPVPPAAPKDGTQHVVSFGLAWLPIVLDQIDDLRVVSRWDSPPDDILQQINELVDVFMTGVSGGNVVYPDNAFVHWTQLRTVAGSDMSRHYATSQVLAEWGLQSTPSSVGHWLAVVVLQAGDYTLEFVGVKGSTRCKFDLILNGDVVDTIDLYNATQVNNFSAVYDVTIPDDGQQTIELVVNGKNASSSNYDLQVSYLAMRGR